MPRRVEYDKAYYAANKERKNAQSRANYRRRREEILAKKRADYCPRANKDRKLRAAYGIGLEDYERMYEEQEGKCGICQEAHDVLHVDHNHDTGEVRELLCTLCNTAFGKMRERVDYLERLLEYGRKYGQKS